MWKRSRKVELSPLQEKLMELTKDYSYSETATGKADSLHYIAFRTPEGLVISVVESNFMYSVYFMDKGALDSNHTEYIGAFPTAFNPITDHLSLKIGYEHTFRKAFVEFYSNPLLAEVRCDEWLPIADFLYREGLKLAHPWLQVTRRN